MQKLSRNKETTLALLLPNLVLSRKARGKVCMFVFDTFVALIHESNTHRVPRQKNNPYQKSNF